MLNAADHLDMMIGSLMTQDFDRPWEIIAVDNGSDDDTEEIARRLLDTRRPPNLVKCEVIAEPSPRGYATPRNAGVRLATSPLLAFCDVDGVVDAGWLSAIVRALEHHPLVGSRKFRVPDSAPDIDTHEPWFEQSELFVRFGFPFVTTAGLGCTRELFDGLGGFDAHFDIGGEDVDFSLRARFLFGIEPLMEHDAIYWTKVPSSPLKSLAKGYRNGRSQVRLYQRHLGYHSEAPSKPSDILDRVATILSGLLHFRRGDRKTQVSNAKRTGNLVGRVVWSARLRVRYF